MPRVLSVDARTPEPGAIAEAARVLREGGLVAFPTETVYGLGARALDSRAVARVFAAKGRPATHPLIAHVEGEAQARALAASWPEHAAVLAREFWPGPITLVVDRAPGVPPGLAGRGPSIAVRAPAHPVALALLAALGEPIAAPSANRYQGLSATTATHVAKGLGDLVDLILDGGACDAGIESTVVDVRGAVPRILRPGALPLGALRRVLPNVEVQAGEVVAAGASRPSPGMDARHYAPRATLLLADTSEAAHALAQVSATRGRSAGLVLHEVARGTPAPGVLVRVLPGDPVAYARELYGTLHALDDAGVATIVVQAVPGGDGAAEAWWAVGDRLKRAATPPPANGPRRETWRGAPPPRGHSGAGVASSVNGQESPAMKKLINPSHFPRPRGYTNGVLCAPGRTLHVAGQVAFDKDARIVSMDFATQFLATLDNVIDVVRAAGGGTEHIVKLLAFVTDLDKYRTAQKAIGEGWRSRMGGYYPAMSLVKVSGLLEPGALVEIEGIAVLPLEDA